MRTIAELSRDRSRRCVNDVCYLREEVKRERELRRLTPDLLSHSVSRRSYDACNVGNLIYGLFIHTHVCMHTHIRTPVHTYTHTVVRFLPVMDASLAAFHVIVPLMRGGKCVTRRSVATIRRESSAAAFRESTEIAEILGAAPFGDVIVAADNSL